MSGLSFAPRALLAGLLLLGAFAAHAQPQDIGEAGAYRPEPGEQFFLLADSSFGSDETARVRLEAPGRDYRRYVMEPYGGVDIRVYRVDKPLDFLRRQKNLHRIRVDSAFRGEGLSNALAYLWDHWYRSSRRAMQRSFAYEARREVTAELPELKLGDSIREPTQFLPQPQYDPIPGLPLVSQFRYPLWEAEPIQPPADTQLSGSSSHFIQPKPGNVEIPVGKLAPGLYVVEALIGSYRATTVLFVADTVAITKIAGNELLVWTAHKREGTAVAGSELLWTDGLGVLSQGRSDAQGLLRLEHLSPERSYVLGQDPAGGVFVSENFYYDSEIYDTKLYAFTDRPLYRPGDWVEVKILGRHFTAARESQRAADAPIELAVIDALGSQLQNLRLDFRGEGGAQARFQLPEGAVAGGYELRFAYREQLYSAAFRVAEYIKPHFEIVLDLDKAEHGTGEPVRGRLSLLYPDGSPVVDAHVQLSLRAQQLSMIDNELQYLGQFPVQLSSSELRTDAKGQALIELPPATEPSRYLLSLFASDGAAYRVRSSREILIERGADRYRLEAARRFSSVGDSVRVQFAREAAGDTPVQTPQHYTWLRLEDRSTGRADLPTGSQHFDLRLPRPGNYTLHLRDASGQILGATSHSVSGAGQRASAGSIEIVLDQREYQTGATAEALITFPEPVDEALLTLERDRVEATALLSEGGSWLSAERLNETQYRVRIPVATQFAPNLTFSALYTRGGEYSFQNAGIVVRMPAVELSITPERELYRPGEEVVLNFTAQRDGRAVRARLSVSVVDEMIYVLQPEIAPAIGDFFYHPRRNNVRTSASLAFISYDVALPGRPGAPPAANRSERGVKVLERPRREEVDTAAWEPDLITDAQGRAQLRFRMPDSLARWRITARAIDGEGLVGQRRGFIRSEQPLYLKWSGPTRFRAGDAPQLGVLAFNQGSEAQNVELVREWQGSQQRSQHALQRGANYLPLEDFELGAGGELKLGLANAAGERGDAIALQLEAAPLSWQAQASLSLTPTGASTPLDLPADANAIELSLAGDRDSLFRGVLDGLIDYPWGCVEQTASRLLPLALAWPSLQSISPAQADRLRLSMQNGRLRLMHLAGPQAQFGWWGSEATPDAFLTAYAYYADLHASRALGIPLPPDHAERALQLYSEQARQLPALQRMLVLDFLRGMGAPVRTLLEGALAELPAAADATDAKSTPAQDRADSLPFVEASASSDDAALLLGLQLARELGASVPAGLSERAPPARERLQTSELPLLRALRVRLGAASGTEQAELLRSLGPQSATFERAIALAWLHAALPLQSAASNVPNPGPGWQRVEGGLTPRWRWTGALPPASLELKGEPDAALSAQLSYRSESAQGDALGLKLTRRLWKLVPGENAFQFSLSAVAADEPLSASALYLDQIELDYSGDQPLRYGLVEVPLPPGADVERTTWGLELVAGPGGVAAPQLERARHEPGEQSYALPVDLLQGKLQFNHLIRFSQRGEFQLPPARYQRMYQPADQAWEDAPLLSRVRVD